jgi:hypothetical protein
LSYHSLSIKGDKVQTLRVVAFLTILTFLPVSMSAQYGTAPKNYYPENYNGSIFKGVVTDTADNHVTLTFTNGGKTDSFTGVFETGCSVPARDGRRMMPADIPKGTVMTAFFNATTKKVDGKRIKENLIIAIAFEVWQGQKATEDKKMIYSCTDQRHLKFRAYQ